MLSHANFLNLVQTGNDAEKPDWNKWTDRRRLADRDADLPYRRLRLGRDEPLSRRQGRDRARIRSDQDPRLLRAIRHHQAVHGAGRDAVRGAAAARAAGRFLAAEIHALWRLADSGGAAEGMHRRLQMRLRADVRHDRNHRHHRRAAAGRPCRGAGAHALGRQGAARHRARDPRSRRQPLAAAPGRRDRHPLRLQHGRLLEPAGSDRAGRSARTAGCAPATPATWTRTAISISTTASRT